MRRLGSAAWIGVTAAALISVAAEVDRYPEARALLAEAEALLPRVVPRERTVIAYSLAELYARGGYLDAGTRLVAVANQPLLNVSARVLYGDTDGALAAARASADPYTRCTILITVGQAAWRTGDKLTAKLALAEAERAARAIPDAVKRKRQLDMAQQHLDALPNDPPAPLSAEPSPPARKAEAPRADLPPFPITLEGFRDDGAAAAAVQADTKYLTALYAAVASRDQAGIEALARTAQSPRKELLGTASLAHLLLQVGAAPAAEEAARSVEADGADRALAKAELLAAAARAWARVKEIDRARVCFDDAVALVKSVNVPALSMGKVKVASAIAGLQSESRLVGAMTETFDLALALAGAVPAIAKRPGLYVAFYGPSAAFSFVFKTALRAERVEIARKAAEGWDSASQGKAAGTIASEWFEAGHRDEALTFARGVRQPEPRARALMDIARRMFDAAGAPNP